MRSRANTPTWPFSSECSAGRPSAPGAGVPARLHVAFQNYQALKASQRSLLQGPLSTANQIKSREPRSSPGSERPVSTIIGVSSLHLRMAGRALSCLQGLCTVFLNTWLELFLPEQRSRQINRPLLHAPGLPLWRCSSSAGHCPRPEAATQLLPTC